jgi:hypothetical protein
VEISAAGSFKVICPFKLFILDARGESAFEMTTAMPMDRFAYVRKRGGNQGTIGLLSSGNGFGLARIIGNAY